MNSLNILFKPKSTYMKNLKNHDSLDWFTDIKYVFLRIGKIYKFRIHWIFKVFLHTHFYVIHLCIFTDIKYVFLRRGKTYKF